MRLRPRHWAARLRVRRVIVIAVPVRRVQADHAAQVVSPVGRHLSRRCHCHWTPRGPVPGPAAGLATALRRGVPVLMLGVLLAGSVVADHAARPGISALTPSFPSPTCSTWSRRPTSAGGTRCGCSAAVFATCVADAAAHCAPTAGGFNQGRPASALAVHDHRLDGRLHRAQRRRYAVRLQEEAASKAVAEERLRIARELHDVVAHSMSVIAVQAGYGQYVIDTQPQTPGRARRHPGHQPRGAGRDRRMLGALRQAGRADAAGLAGARPGEPGAAPPARAAGADARAADDDAAGARPGLGPGPPAVPRTGLADLDRLVSRTAARASGST